MVVEIGTVAESKVPRRNECESNYEVRADRRDSLYHYKAKFQ